MVDYWHVPSHVEILPGVLELAAVELGEVVYGLRHQQFVTTTRSDAPTQSMVAATATTS